MKRIRLGKYISASLNDDKLWSLMCEALRMLLLLLFKMFLNHMAQQEVQPNVQTFNAVLKTLRRCGGVGRSMAVPVIKEMEALEIGKITRMPQPE